MKIVFDSVEEKKEFIEKLSMIYTCPGMLGLKETDLCTSEINVIKGYKNVCEFCWEKALKTEVNGNENKN